MLPLGTRHNFHLIESSLNAPHPSARKVIEILAHTGPRREEGVAALRRRYNVSRRPFLAEMEPVESVLHICPAEPGVPRLTIFRPKDYRPGETRPALVFLHGGGWTLGSLATYEPFCRQLANACGMILIWVEYRLAPEHPFPAAYDDTLAAWNWVQKNYRELGVDPFHIAIGGDSAGGNLAAAACIALRAEPGILPWRQLLLYPCLDLSASLPSHRKFADDYLLTADLYAWYRKNYVGDNYPGDWRLSPLAADSLAGLPPALILQAGFDILKDESTLYAARLRQARVPVETLHFGDMIHGFLTMGGAIPAAQVAIRRIAGSLRA